MDKRTILFVLGLTLSLFLVNLYFEHQNKEKLIEWSRQQKAKNEQKIKNIEEDIKLHTAKAEDLPLVSISSDQEGKDFLSGAVLSGKTALTFAWQDKMPETVYVDKSGKAVEMRLANPSVAFAEPAIYQESSSSFMPISTLSEVGKFDLQLVSLNPKNKEKPFEITLGEYTDGRFEVPNDKLLKLKEPEKQKTLSLKKNAIALLKTTEGYAPVAIYAGATGTIDPLNVYDPLTPYIQKTAAESSKTAVSSSQKIEELFYVLENDYQQLVFSNYGGALIEINLPFQTNENSKSVVKEIEIDKKMVKDHPYNALFPAHAYFTPGENPRGPFVENSKGKLGGYYPLLRRDLIETKQGKTIRVKPEHYALNIVSEYPEIAELVYEVKSFDKTKIVFEAKQPHRRITKTFSVEPELGDAPYSINALIQIEGDARGLWITSGVPEVEWISGSPAPSLKYRITRNQKVDVESIDLPKEVSTFSNLNPDWISNSNGFLGMILDPLSDIDAGFKAQFVSGKTLPSRLSILDINNNQYKPDNLPGYELLMPLKSNGGTMKFRLFAGPFSTDVLKTIDKVYSDPATGYNPDYIACQTFHGWFAFISEPFAKFLWILMEFFHRLTGSWGFSIILLTVALRVMLYPLNAWSAKSMIKMQQIAPQVTAIQEKFKKDPKKAQLEIMNLYREKGVNPVSGCFPLLIQMPFLIGMFDLLKSTFELRGASFIPGWIDDLAAPDVLFSWTQPVWLIGNQFHLLPILLGLVMFFQQRVMSNLPKDTNLLTDQQRQQRTMGNMMTVVFAVMFYNFPSGLNIYWLSSMVLGIIQQWWTQRRLTQKKA